MHVQVRHIQKRGNSFYFRLAIPADLQIHFGGQREISKTLQTSDPFLAFIKAGELRDRYKRMFHSYRHGDDVQNESGRLPNLSALPHIPYIEPVVDQVLLLSDVLNELLRAKPCKRNSVLARKSSVRLLTDWYGELRVILIRPLRRYGMRSVIMEKEIGAVK
ncbi:MAG: hypothetical protein ISR84_01815 [Kiritimatiellales bacterium]|nr:hypothetical protein [Kiritimatiellales bacterium]